MSDNTARIHEMRLDAAPFGKIKSGEKTVELRLYDEKRRAIALGDTIRFTRRDDGETLKARVVGLCRFSSFGELYKVLPLDKCGYAPSELAAASPRDMDEYYSPEDQAKYGVIGICIELAD